MNKIILATLVSLLSVSSAYAGAQQEKMKACNAEAKGKKGDERKAFMSECLKKDSKLPPAPEADAKTPQQNKMKTCNQEAGEKQLKGDDRKKFMSTCLKG